MTEPRPEMSDKPPLLGSWRRVYAAEIGIVAVFVVVLWWLTERYS